MEKQGKVIACLEPKTGTNSKGEWTAQDFVIESPDGNYTKKMVFTVWGLDRIQKFNIAVGQSVNVSFDIDAREHQGRWFNSVRAYDVRQLTTQDEIVTQQDATKVEPQPTAQAQSDLFGDNGGDPFGAPANDSDGLPF